MRYRTRNSVIALVIAAACVTGFFVVRRQLAPLPRNDQITWYLHRTRPLFRMRSTFVSFSTVTPPVPMERLTAALEKPETFAAAHMLLLDGAPVPPPTNSYPEVAQSLMAARLAGEG